MSGRLGRPSRLFVFTGEGKGKTTAALGMALRAVGHGQRVLFVQFLKSDTSVGEVVGARSLPGFSLRQTGHGFVPPPSHPAYAKHKMAALEGLAIVERALRDGVAELVVLDEVCVAIAKGLLDVAAVLTVFGNTRPGTNVVLTGRGAPEALVAAADTVTHMGCVKHALQTGRRAEAGVEW
jgi:cob(I)alamin adenosyltransferase